MPFCVLLAEGGSGQGERGDPAAVPARAGHLGGHDGAGPQHRRRHDPRRGGPLPTPRLQPQRLRADRQEHCALHLRESGHQESHRMLTVRRVQEKVGERTEGWFLNCSDSKSPVSKKSEPDLSKCSQLLLLVNLEYVVVLLPGYPTGCADEETSTCCCWEIQEPPSRNCSSSSKTAHLSV